MGDNVKLIAMYFTQLHAIPENDEWWGKGFTDWVNVKKAKPLYKGHYQPRVPLNKEYYDQSHLSVLSKQVELAKKYGIYGFCHYHYWFDGKQLLETPTNLMLENPDIDMPFCLSWANETWSRRWDGQDHHILIQQTHTPTKEKWLEHFNYLIKAWTDKRAIKIDGKPVFIIYRPQKIEKIDEMLEFWQDKAKEHGLKGLYFMFQMQYELTDPSCLKSFDAKFHFQPFVSINTVNYGKSAVIKAFLRRVISILPNKIQSLIWSIWTSRKNGMTIHDYDAVWQQIINNCESADLDTYPGAFVDWDNTARYGDRATIFKGASPSKFSFWFEKLVQAVLHRPSDRRYIFINAWNEWAEGAYLEPDEVFGCSYLEAVQKALEDNMA